MSLDNVARIEDKIDKAAAGATVISMSLGGVQFQTMMELMEFAKLMSVSGAAVPPHLRANPGACLAICTRALRFGFDPFSLAEHSYSMKKSAKTDNGWEDVESIAYDSFVLAAIIEAHAPITGRMRITYEGEGGDRTCTVSATPRGEKEPVVLKSPTLAACIKRIGRSEKGNLRGSPLWETKPDQQLAYDTRRDFCRRYFPEVLLGWYDKDEFDEHNTITVETDKPDIGKRLKKKEGARGFDHDGVQRALEHKPGQTLPENITDTREPVPIGNEAPAEQQMELSAGDVETELENKRRAIDNCDTVAEVNAIASAVTEFLKANKRTELLADFLSHANKRGKKLEKAA